MRTSQVAARWISRERHLGEAEAEVYDAMVDTYINECLQEDLATNHICKEHVRLGLAEEVTVTVGLIRRRMIVPVEWCRHCCEDIMSNEAVYPTLVENECSVRGLEYHMVPMCKRCHDKFEQCKAELAEGGE